MSRTLVNDRSQDGGAKCRILHGKRISFCGKTRYKFIRNFGINNDALSGHANLSLVQERSKGGCIDRCIKVCIVENNQWCLATQFQKYGLQVTCRSFGDNPSYPGGPCEVDVTHRRMIDKCSNYLGSICGIVRKYIDNAVGKTGLVEYGADEPMHGRACF